MDKRDADEGRWAQLRARRRWGVQEAKWAVAAWAASGETLASFAESRGVHPERLRRWRERLGNLQSDMSAAPGQGTAAPTLALVPVTVRPRVTPPVAGDEGAVVVTTGELRIAIRDLNATSPDWVARLIARAAAEVAS